MSWIETNLKDLVEIKTGKKDANEGDENGAFRFYTCAKEYSFIKEYAFDEEAILVSGNGAYVGYVHYFNGKFDAYQRTYILSNFKVDVFFLYHYLGEKLRFRIHREKQDGATPYITKGTLAKFKIEYPENPAEQTAIATLLSKVDEAIAATQASIKAAEKLKKALMQNLLTGKLKPDGSWRSEDEFYEDEKFGKVPQGWATGTLKDIAEVIAGQSPTGDTYNEEGKGIAMLNGPTEFTDYYPIPVQYTTKPTKICEVGDILFTVRGSSTGRMNFADQPYCIGRGIAAIRANENSDISFLYYTLVTIAHKILAEAKGAGSTFPNVNRGELNKKRVIVPMEREVQQIIGSKIKEVELFEKSKQTKIQTLQRLKKSLMQNLLTGKVRLPKEFIATFEKSIEE